MEAKEGNGLQAAKHAADVTGIGRNLTALFLPENRDDVVSVLGKVSWIFREVEVKWTRLQFLFCLSQYRQWVFPLRNEAFVPDGTVGQLSER